MDEVLKNVIKDRLKQLKEPNFQSEVCLDKIIDIVAEEIEKNDIEIFKKFIEEGIEISNECECSHKENEDCDCTCHDE